MFKTVWEKYQSGWHCPETADLAAPYYRFQKF